MDYQHYLNLFEDIINNKSPYSSYYQPKYFDYVKLNYSRMSRWQKALQLNNELVKEIKGISRFQKWIIITEPWCGDAAPIIPFLVRLAEQNSLIQYDLQLRDQEPFLISSYLTNGTKSIPKLIVKDEAGKDLFTWGPRPLAAKQMINNLKMSGLDPDAIKAELQNWYNKDKGAELQKELLQLFKDKSS